MHERTRGRGHAMRGQEWMGMGGLGGWGGRGRRRARRGDIRRAILSALADGPANGYEIIKRLETKTGGMWRPSPGSVYPTLQLLEDEGLARSEERDGSRTYALTDQGSAQARAEADDPTGPAPWDGDDETDEQLRTLRGVSVQLLMAAKQVANAGKPDQVARATEIVQRARKDLYGLLAED